MQAQLPTASYVGLWSRLAKFRHDELSALIESRKIVRIALMRSTLHLVSGRDALALRPLFASSIERAWRNSAWFRGVDGLDLETLVRAGKALIEAQPMTSADLGARLAEQWPKRDADSLAQAIRTFLPLVQVPPRGVWGKGGLAKVTTAETWLGRPLAQESSMETLLVRYLRAFGPASIKDAQAWSGVSKLREEFERLRRSMGKRLVVLHDEAGEELFDVADAPRPDAATKAPPRFLPEYDNLFLSHDDRTHVFDAEARSRVFVKNGMRAGVLVDGFLRGTWKVERSGRRAMLRVSTWGEIGRRDLKALEAEAGRLVAFVGDRATSHEWEITSPP
jgi:hypothetical protein